MRVVDDLSVQSARCPRQLRRPERPCPGSLQERKTHLDEGLDLVPLRQLLATHPLGDLPGVPFNASNNGMRVGPLLRSLIELFDYDRLLACMASLCEDGDLHQ